MAQTQWTAQVYVDSVTGTINPVVQAATLEGAKRQIERIYGPVIQISNIQELPRNGGVNYSYSGGGPGLLTRFVRFGFYCFLALCVTMFLANSQEEFENGNDNQTAIEYRNY